MSPVLLAFALLAGDTAAAAPRHDPWFGADKVKHGVFAFAVQGGGYAALRAGADHRTALAGAVALTAGLSLLKEYRDRGRTGFSARDLAWDAAGIVLATVVLSHQPRR